MNDNSQIKKLRGSGGYILALVTDDQQRKGNLGGPDLFLAPIGRLDAEKIKKYSCNTCDKEYDGGPKIEYENPNEDVAENLILIERGQYLCTICGSAIAEYREFKKTDQFGDVGNAKPLETKAEIIEESMDDTEQASDDQYHTFDDFGETDTEAKPVESFSAISGMSVFDENAKQIGIAKQVGVASNSEVVLIISNNDGDDVSINWKRIKKVGEIIMLGDSSSTPNNTSTQQGLRCPSCNFDNKPESKFCQSCGTKI